MRKHIRTVSVVAALMLLTACSRSVTVKIGVAAPVSGPSAPLGMDIVNGARTAVDELNDQRFLIDGKVARFELVVEDDHASTEQGKIAADRLVQSGVAAVVGHLNSHVSISTAPVYANAGIPQLSVSTSPEYTRMGLKTAFRIVADDLQQAAALSRVVREKLRAKSIYILDDGSAYGVGLAKEVARRLKEKNVDYVYTSIAQSADHAATVQKIAEAKADLVFYGGDEVIGVPLLQEMKKSGVTAKFVAGDGMCDISSVKRAGDAATSSFYCSIAGVPPSWLSAGIGFVQLYKSRFGEPGQYSPLAYDAVHIFAQAMQQARSTSPEVYLHHLSTGSFNSKVQGSVEFDAKGDLKDSTVVVYRFLDGRLVEQRNFL